MAYVYTDPTSIEYILQRAHDELRRGENQHYRSTEAQFTNHVKELLGNLERYLETCGVRLPAEVQDGGKVTALAVAANEQERERAAFVVASGSGLMATQRPSQNRQQSGRSASASASVMTGNNNRSDRVAINNANASLSGPARGGWGNLATPREGLRGDGAAAAERAAQRGRTTAALSSSPHGSPLRSVAAHSVCGSPSSPLGVVYQRHPHSTADNRSARTTNSESGASILYNSQQATRAHAAYSSGSPSMAVEVAVDTTPQSNMTSLMYSGDAAGVDSCSVDSGSAPIVAIIGSRRGAGTSSNRGQEEHLTTSMPPALARPPPEHQSKDGTRNSGGGNSGGGGVGGGGHGPRADTVSRSASTHLTVSNAIAAASGVPDTGVSTARAAAGHDRWGEFGTFVQSITESRQNSNLASLQSAAATGYPQPDCIGANGTLVAALPSSMRDGESVGAPPLESVSEPPAAAPLAVAAPSPSVTPKVGFQLPYVLSTGTSMTTPSTPVLAVAAHRQVQLSPLSWGGAKLHTTPIPPSVAQGGGSSAVRILAVSGAAAELVGGSARVDGDVDGPLSTFSLAGSPSPAAPQHRSVRDASVEVPRVECIPSPPAQVHSGRPAYLATAPVPAQRAVSMPFASQRLHFGSSGGGADAPEHYQQALRSAIPPPARPALAGSKEKDLLMRRLRGVLERSTSVTSATQASAQPLAAGAPPPQPPARAWLVGPATPSPPPPALPAQLPEQRHAASSPVAAGATDTRDRLVPAPRSATSSEHANADDFDDVVREPSRNESWSVVRLATAEASGCPYTSSSKNISSGPATSQSASRGTVQPKDAGNGDGGSSGPPRRSHASREARRAHRHGSNSSNHTGTATAMLSGGLSVGGAWDAGSCTTANSTSAPTHTKDTMAPSFVVSAQRHPPSSLLTTPWMRPTRSPPSQSPLGNGIQGASGSDGYPPGLTKSDIDNGSRVECNEVVKARRRLSVGETQGSLSDTHPTLPRESVDRGSRSVDSSAAGSVKHQLMVRLRTVLGHREE
ncbi:hypothetical protein NESM_000386400 [Novymonas esmeraldas]|uniref:Uncharacterized protein n=1 Tax=Novymonas esmeraldas TaxID=1808958 RepID=A0AAW0EMW7_9TRYP